MGGMDAGVDVTVVGGGIVGLATARALLRRGVARVRVVEKESAIARHQSSHNSGVLHAGLQYAPGSAKARMARLGIQRMRAFCETHDVPHDTCGKLVVATRREELPRLEELHERGKANGLQGLRRVSAEEAREIEPHVPCVAGLHVPEEGIVDYHEVSLAIEREVLENGGEVRCGAEVRSLVRTGSRWRISTTAGEFESEMLANCAGLYSDRIVAMAGGVPPCRIVPFRGDYYRLRRDREHLIRHLVYPLPEPGFPFLGVHFTRRIGGGVDAGPNAVLAFAREGYSPLTVHVPELLTTLSFPGLWRFAARHHRMVARELAQSLSRGRFLAALQRLVPEITENDLTSRHSGVRAQAMLPSGQLVSDFLWAESPGAVHAVNCPSPAATASLAIGNAIARRIQRQMRVSA